MHLQYLWDHLRRHGGHRTDTPVAATGKERQYLHDQPGDGQESGAIRRVIAEKATGRIHTIRISHGSEFVARREKGVSPVPHYSIPRGEPFRRAEES